MIFIRCCKISGETFLPSLSTQNHCASCECPIRQCPVIYIPFYLHRISQIHLPGQIITVFFRMNNCVLHAVFCNNSIKVLLHYFTEAVSTPDDCLVFCATPIRNLSPSTSFREVSFCSCLSTTSSQNQCS